MRHRINALLFSASRRPVLFRTGILLFLLVSLGIVLTSRFSADIVRAFPERSVTGRTLRALSAGSSAPGRIVILFHDEKIASCTEYLGRAGERIRHVPGVTSVRVRAMDLPPDRIMEELAAELPSRIPPERIPGGKALEEECRNLLRKLTLAGPGSTAFFRADPLGLTLPAMQRLREFQALSGVTVDPSSGYLLSRDGKCAMILAGTRVKMGDSGAIRTLFRELETCLQDSPCSVHFLSPLLHASANEEALKRDLLLMGILSAIIFPLLFLVCYKRDFRTLVIPAVPFLAMIPAAAVLRIVSGEILLFPAGLGGIVGGLGMDYGIHLYAASAGGLRRMMRIVPSLVPALLTSAAAFLVFLFSGTEVFLQFGLFAAASLVFSFFFFLMLMPGFFLSGKRTVPQYERKENAVSKEKTAWIAACVWILMMTLFAVGLCRLRFNGDFRAFDIGRTKYAASEELFRNSFRTGSPPGMVLFSSERELVEKLPLLRSRTGENFFAFTDLTGTETERRRNRELWQKNFPAKREELETHLAALGVEKEFILPFVRAVERGMNAEDHHCPVWDPVREFLASGPVSYALFADRPGSAEKIVSLGSPVLSERYTSHAMTNDLFRSLIPPGIASFVLVLGIIVLEFRASPFSVAGALLPLVSAVAAAGGICGLLGRCFDPSLLIPVIIIAGISVDYGIIMMKENIIPQSALRRAIGFSAVTTMAGGATVLFTEHRMLASSGLVILTGILAAWLTGAWISPLLRKTGKMLRKILPLLLLLPLAGCLSEPFEYRDNGPLAGEKRKRLSVPFRAQCSAVLDWRFGKSTFLAAVRGEKDGRLIIAGMNPSGFMLFAVSGTGEEPDSVQWFLKGTKEKEGLFAARSVYYAIRRTLLPGECTFLVAGTPPRISGWKGTDWVLRTASWKEQNGIVYPYEILYDFQGLRIALRVLGLREGERP